MKEENKKPEGKKKWTNAWQWLFFIFTVISILTCKPTEFHTENLEFFIGEISGALFLPALCFFFGYIRPKYIQKKEVNSITFYSAIILFCILIFKIILVVYALFTF